MKSFYKHFFLFFLLTLISSNLLFSQGFQKNVFIDIAGDNYDFDIISSDYPPIDSYITWINKKDSIYTVYLKQISPEFGENIVISSDSTLKSNPKVAFNLSGIRIVLQNNYDGLYEIITRTLINDTISDKIIIKDSLTSDPQITLKENSIAWIEGGNLVLKHFYPNLSDEIYIDSAECSSPNLPKDDIFASTQILYEKKEGESNLIYLAEFDAGENPPWQSSVISEGKNNNPNYGIIDGVSFETIDSVSRIKYSGSGTRNFNETKNESCNFRNPYVFSYNVPTGASEIKTPFFVAFDSDSLENNNEVFIKTFYFGTFDSLINISNMEGDDYKPEAALLSINDTTYAAIFWIHEDNLKLDIWISKEVFNPIFTEIENGNTKINSFQLLQNYPNPFNPATTIEYILSKPSNITLDIYNLLGQKIQTIDKGYRSVGSHSIVFNAANLSSGGYIYVLKTNYFIQAKKLILVK